jgi:hypothetical protein
MDLVSFLVLAAWIWDDSTLMIVMTVDSEVLEEEEGGRIVLWFPEVVAVYLLEFSCVLWG